MNILNSLGTKFAEILRLKRQHVDAAVKELGLTRTQWRVLLWIRALGVCTQKKLLSKLDIDAGQLARVLDDFEKNNIIKREPLKCDRRCLSVEMTDFGYDKYIPKLEEIIQKEHDILVKNFSKLEQKQLSIMLDQVIENMETSINEKGGVSDASY